MTKGNLQESTPWTTNPQSYGETPDSIGLTPC